MFSIEIKKYKNLSVTPLPRNEYCNILVLLYLSRIFFHPYTGMHAQSLSLVRLFVTPWTAAYQAPLSMWLPRQEYWSGWSFPSPGYLSGILRDLQGSNPCLLHWQADSLPLSHQGKSLPLLLWTRSPLSCEMPMNLCWATAEINEQIYLRHRALVHSNCSINTDIIVINNSQIPFILLTTSFLRYKAMYKGLKQCV